MGLLVEPHRAIEAPLQPHSIGVGHGHFTARAGNGVLKHRPRNGRKFSGVIHAIRLARQGRQADTNIISRETNDLSFYLLYEALNSLANAC